MDEFPGFQVSNTIISDIYNVGTAAITRLLA